MGVMEEISFKIGRWMAFKHQVCNACLIITYWI